MLKRLFSNWEESVSRFQLRGITSQQLLIIKNKWKRENQLIQAINQLRKERNQLSQEGKKRMQHLVLGITHNMLREGIELKSSKNVKD